MEAPGLCVARRGQDLYGITYLNSCEKEVVRIGTACIRKGVTKSHILLDSEPPEDEDNHAWPPLLEEQQFPWPGNPLGST